VDFCEMLHGVPVHRIVVHGVSIGGALASAVAAQRPGVNCTLDQTFCSAREVAVHSAQNLTALVPSWVAESVAKTCFPIGITDPRLPGVQTDGYDTLAKAGEVEGHVFVFSANEDHMMPQSFADALFEGHYRVLKDRCLDEDYTCHLRIAQVKRRLHKFGVDTNSPIVRASKKPELRAMLAEAADRVDLHRVASARQFCHEGEHGSFFGDDRTGSQVYYDYLRSIGCVDPAPTLSMTVGPLDRVALRFSRIRPPRKGRTMAEDMLSRKELAEAWGQALSVEVAADGALRAGQSCTEGGPETGIADDISVAWIRNPGPPPPPPAGEAPAKRPQRLRQAKQVYDYEL